MTHSTAPSQNQRTMSSHLPAGKTAWVLKLLAAYLLGIVVCVTLTPVSVELAGVKLWLYFPGLAAPGYFLFYFYLEGPYLPESAASLAYWLWFAVGLTPIVAELAAFFLRRSSWKSWRPIWIGGPIGFVGTLGVYFTAAASV